MADIFLSISASSTAKEVFLSSEVPISHDGFTQKYSAKIWMVGILGDIFPFVYREIVEGLKFTTAESE